MYRFRGGYEYDSVLAQSVKEGLSSADDRSIMLVLGIHFGH